MARGSTPWRLAFGWAVAVAVAACTLPRPEACELECGEAQRCPDDFQCQTSANRCVPVGYAAACEGAATDPGGPLLPEAGNEPEPSQPPIEADAIVAPDPDGEVSLLAPLAIAVAAEEALCTGSHLARTFTASGGAGTYAWELIEAPPGLSGHAIGNAEFRVEGVASAAGALRVELRDGASATVSDALAVREAPRVVNAELPATCPDQLYAAALAATGGDADSYGWSVALVGDPGLPDSLEALGLTLSGSEITGRFSSPSGAAPVRIAVDVHDAHCRSGQATLALDVLEAGTAACPRIQLRFVDVSDDASLPPACLGVPYREELAAEGGAAGAVWRAIATPPGLRFDAGTQVISGTPEGTGALVVQVTAGARVIERELRLSPRAACWFARVDRSSEPASLELVDARRLTFRDPAFEVVGARRVISDAATGEGVRDFQFSPDRERLAYRREADGGAERLLLLDLRTGAEAQLLPNATGYAWSADGSRLAASAATDAGPSLHILERTDTAMQPALPALPLYDVAAPGLSAHSAPVWFGSDSVALLLDDPVTPGLLSSGYFAPASGELGFVLLDEPRPAGVALRPGPAGFFVSDGLVRYLSPGRERITHDEVVISPSGRYVARSRDGVLRAFHAHQSAARNAPEEGGATSGCSRLLAWALERERIVCWSEEQGSLMVYDLLEVDVARLALTEVGAVEGSYRYLLDTAPARQRVLSSKGTWLAFDTPSGVFLADLGADAAPGSARIAERVRGAASSAADDRTLMSFSPDERWLALHLPHGELSLLSLVTGESWELLSDDLGPPASCTESTFDPSSGWCGSELPNGSLHWAPGSDLLAQDTETGGLRIHDFSQLGFETWDELLLEPSCAGACAASRTPGFQP